MRTKPIVVGRQALEAQVAQKLCMSKVAVSNVVRVFLSGFARELALGRTVTIRQLGSFDTRVSRRAARANPFRAGEVIPARVEAKVRFRAGKGLRAMVQATLDGGGSNES